MAEILSSFLSFLDKGIGVTTDFRGATKSMTNELTESQQTIIKLQSQLLISKTTRLIKGYKEFSQPSILVVYKHVFAT